MRPLCCTALAMAVVSCAAFASSSGSGGGSGSYETQDWQKDIGKAAPRLVGSGWVGTPVSLDAVHGNTVVLAFWNADVAC